ncbi:conserved hypothetical protein [Solidesulfovibrio fructosivorans JJ]]|uniref:L,D-TPase catalytic domain-containing protein n=1 Tax=Solidesulfovibrio fructosivorans JJ] TaxID=596151 RepID=E1K1E1_SOLFR|nr:L,D-transpeptidase [Solidesulfovibrio fructosivorans]EFL49556.1 conserved hypothetical protein [Solidesulfovibrio fructosivorans JJ]]
MPEVAGSSRPSGVPDLLLAKQAGFPRTGSPLFVLPARRGPGLFAETFFLAVLFLALLLPAQAAQKKKPRTAPSDFGVVEAGEASTPALRQELARIAVDYAATVTAKTLARVGRSPRLHRLDMLTAPSRQYRDDIRLDALSRLSAAGADLSASQFFVYADRNPATQLAFLAFYDAGAKKVLLLGVDFISTGKLRAGKDSFLTPVGVFENTPENWSYRAQGTKNSKGWRGLGARGSRVWDFGFQQAPRKFRQGVYDSQMRLLMHATDPDQGEPRLGGTDSKGCVRISAASNAFFDRYSILDRRYEEMAVSEPDKDMWILRTGRTPVANPGSYLVVGDSANYSASR